MRLRSLSVVTAAFTYLTILVGGYTRGTGSGYGCRDAWPLCAHPETGQLHLFPDWSNFNMVVEWGHRFVALIAGVLILWVLVAVWRNHRSDKRLLTAATIAGVLLPTQALLGAATVWYFTGPNHGWLATLHMGTAAALFGAVIATTIFARYPRDGTRASARPGDEPADPPATEPSATPGDYVRMLKLGIISLLVAMGVAGMVLAGGDLTFQEAFWTLLGGALAAGAGGVINQVIERDLDRRMDRTQARPVAAGRIAPDNALAFAMVLAAAAFTMQAFMVNVLTAVLTLIAVLFYVFIYTLWLKPSTPQGVVIGGAAGAAPALVGWAAVTGEIGMPAILLGFVVFLWTPPHFWALAIAKRTEYADAGFPMMPVVRGLGHTKRQMVLYTLATILAAALFYPMGVLGMPYLVASTLLGAGFLGAILWVVIDHDEVHARAAFWISIVYLFGLFGSMVADKLLL